MSISPTKNRLFAVMNTEQHHQHDRAYSPSGTGLPIMSRRRLDFDSPTVPTTHAHDDQRMSIDSLVTSSNREDGPNQQTLPSTRTVSTSVTATGSATTSLVIDHNRHQFKTFFMARLRHPAPGESQTTLYEHLCKQNITREHIQTEMANVQRLAAQAVQMCRHVDLDPHVGTLHNMLGECIAMLRHTLCADVTSSPASIMYKLATLGHPHLWISLFHVEHQERVLDTMTRIVGGLVVLSRSLALPKPGSV